MRYSLKTLFIVQAVILVCCFLLIQSGIIQIHYPKVVEKSPLIAPVKVKSIDHQKFVLEDGRWFRIPLMSADFVRQLQESDYLIDIESNPSGYSLVYVNERGWLCGTPWAQGLIQIPLIADEVSVNRRTFVAEVYELKAGKASIQK